MLILLSSGTRPRYLQDVLRALAMPDGTQMHFRYDRDWVGSDVLERIGDGSVLGEEAIIAYADQAEPPGEETPIEIVPLRWATIVSASLPGKTVTIGFAFRGFAFAENVDSFNSDLVNLAKGLPTWKESKPAGLYCVTLSSRPKYLEDSSDLATWEKLVDQLAGRPDFTDLDTFVTTLGLFTNKDRERMGAKIGYARWPKSCPADQSRELLLYHFHPSKAPAGWLIRGESGDGLSITSDRVAVMDSRYDLKRFVLRSGDPPVGKISSWVRLTVEASPSARKFDVEMDLRVTSNFWKRVVLAAVVGLALAGSQVVPLVTRNDLSDGEKVASGLGILLFALVVGVAAAWGLRRGV